MGVGKLRSRQLLCASASKPRHRRAVTPGNFQRSYRSCSQRYNEIASRVPYQLTHGSPSAFFQSIALSTGNSLQDTLRLLTLWFKYGYHAEVGQAISEGFRTVSVDIWLEVIPQVCEM